jgi:Ca2+-binding RTX toxin-like protein
MTLTVISTVRQTGQSVSANSTLYVLAAGAVVVNGTTVGVSCGNGALVSNLGVIMAQNAALTDGGLLTSGQRILNAGTILATTAAAVRFQNATATDLTLVNTGEISTTGAGKAAISLLAGGNVITNHGTISSATGLGINILLGDAGRGNTITNTGIISTGNAAGTAIGMDNAVDRVINTGDILGDIRLGGGSDIYDGRSGHVTGTVMGGAGNDTYRLSDANTVLGELSGGGVDTVVISVDYALGGQLERLVMAGNAITGSGNDLANTLTGNGRDNLLFGGLGEDTLQGGGGDDILRAGDGEDVLTGGRGLDVMYGGAGDDRFVFSSSFDSLSSGPDVVGKFRRGGDHIDLRTLDGNADVDGSQNFTFRGTGAFTAAGQVRIVDDGADLRIEINLDSDKGSEMEIIVQDMTTLSFADFYL